MSGEPAGANPVGVFWNVDDCPLPHDLIGIPNQLLRRSSRVYYDDDLYIKIYSKNEILDVGMRLVSKDITDEVLRLALECLITRNYKVFVAQPGEEVLPCVLSSFPSRSLWIWNTLAHGGKPLAIRGIKRKRGDDDSESLFEATMSGETLAGKQVQLTCLLLDLYDLPLPGGISPFDLHNNIKSGLEKRGFNVEAIEFFVYPSKARPLPDIMVEVYKECGMLFLPEVSDRIKRAEWMLHDIGLWMMDNPSSTPYNLVIVSNNFAESGCLYTRFLDALRSRGHRVLLVQEDKTDSGTETLDWLWKTIFTKPDWMCKECIQI